MGGESGKSGGGNGVDCTSTLINFTNVKMETKKILKD